MWFNDDDCTNSILDVQFERDYADIHVRGSSANISLRCLHGTSEQHVIKNFALRYIDNKYTSEHVSAYLARCIVDDLNATVPFMCVLNKLGIKIK